MDPLITLALGAVLGSGVSGFLVWLGTRQAKPETSGDITRALRDLVGRGILPSQVWEQISREIRGQGSQTVKLRPLGYQTEPEHASLATRNGPRFLPFIALWIAGLFFVFRNPQETNLVLASAFCLLSLATAGIAYFFTRLNRFWALTGLYVSGLAACVIAPLAGQGEGADPQKLIAAGWWGMVTGLSVLTTLRSLLLHKNPGAFWGPLVGVFLFLPVFLLPADWARWNPTERAWVDVISGPWAIIAGISWALLTLASRGFSKEGLALFLTIVGLWTIGWGALALSGKSSGNGMPSAFWAVLAGSVLAAACQRFFLGKGDRASSNPFPFGSWGLANSLFLSSLAFAGAMIWTGIPLGKAGGFLLAATLIAGLNLSLVRHPIWGIGLAATCVAGFHCLSVSIHNGVPLIAWWPFEAKALGLALSLGTLLWCLALWQFPARKWGVLVSLFSLIGCLAWLLPTQALVLATLVEPSWMSEVIRAPLAGWWNWPLAIFSVGFAWAMHRTGVSSRAEIWLTIFILIGGGLATAGATLGLDTEESPQGVLAVLATWTVGAFLLGLFKSQWASFFSTLFALFAWFLAWSQPERMPIGSSLWSLVPGLLAWGTGITQSLIHGKRWLPLACIGSLMVAMSSWSAFESVDLGPGILIGSLLMSFCLVCLEFRYSRDWLAPNGYKKTLRLREPAFWLATTQILVLIGSFLSIRESTYDWWLPVAVATQVSILWLVRGNASNTLANLQSLGASLTGGLTLMGIGEFLRRSGGLEEMLTGVSPMTIFVPGTLIGLGIRQTFLLAGLVQGKGRTLGVLVLLGLLVGKALSDLFNKPSTGPEWSIALFSSFMWVVLAWAGALFEEKGGSSTSKAWYQATLGIAIVPLTLLFVVLGNYGFGPHLQILGPVILAASLVAVFCLTAPSVDLPWTLQQRQAFSPSTRRLVGFSLGIQGLLLYQTLMNREQPGALDLAACCGFLISSLVAGISSGKQKGYAKTVRMQIFSLSTLTLFCLWLCTEIALSPFVSRGITLAVGATAILLGSFRLPFNRLWGPVLQGVGLSVPFLAAMLACLSLNPQLQGTQFQQAWGFFHPTVSPESALIQATVFALLLGILGLIAPTKAIHNSIRYTFAAWAIAGWIGFCVTTQGISTQGVLICLAGFLAGTILVLRELEGRASIIPSQNHRGAA